MRTAFLRFLAIGAGTVLVFAGVVLLLIRIVPGPHRSLDYLVIGSAATLAAMVVLFLTVLVAWPSKPVPHGSASASSDQPQASPAHEENQPPPGAPAA